MSINLIRDSIREWLTIYMGLDGWNANLPSEESTIVLLQAAGFKSVEEFRTWEKESGADELRRLR